MRYYTKLILLFIMLLPLCAGAQVSSRLQRGWKELVKDNDKGALEHFYAALREAEANGNTADKAEALLYLGIAAYGADPDKGLEFATAALTEYQKLTGTAAALGRGKCLQLISTIYTRQGKSKKALQMSREAISLLEHKKDTAATLGLAYATVGRHYETVHKPDSAHYFYAKALEDFNQYKKEAYLPGAYINIGRQSGNNNDALKWYNKALNLSETTGNRQGEVSALCALGSYYLAASNVAQAEGYFTKAHRIAGGLSDKMFTIKTLGLLSDAAVQKGDYNRSNAYLKELLVVKDSVNSIDKARIIKKLEVQFEVAEKDRTLASLAEEKKTARLISFLLAGILLVLLALIGFGIYSFRRSRKKDSELLKTREALVEARQIQDAIRQQQLQNELEHKEGHLSAITLQMLEKNELLEAIKSLAERGEAITGGELHRLVSGHQAKGTDWGDFDTYFESLNKNFYARLKETYPEISANDLKMCALIKLNLSIKEMASILNISPDSVKTARYRLRKKLQLANEDNLKDFIMTL